MKLHLEIISIVLLGVMAAGARAQEWPFQNYPAVVSKEKPAPLQLDTPLVRAHISHIRKAVQRGPDFAGHYTVADWGCGTECGVYIIVDGTFLSTNSKVSVSQSLSETSTSPSLWPTISEFYVASDSFVVEGRGLARVDVLSIPAGTGITRERYQRIGNMTKKSDQSAKQIWTMPVACPGLVTNVLAIGWNVSGQEVGELYLPYNGVGEIARILCPHGIP